MIALFSDGSLCSLAAINNWITWTLSNYCWLFITNVNGEAGRKLHVPSWKADKWLCWVWEEVEEGREKVCEAAVGCARGAAWIGRVQGRVREVLHGLGRGIDMCNWSGWHKHRGAGGGCTDGEDLAQQLAAFLTSFPIDFLGKVKLSGKNERSKSITNVEAYMQ